MESRLMSQPGLLLWASESTTAEFLGLARLAEECGYSELWYTDSRFDRDAYVGLAMAARHTNKLLIGPGVSDPYSRHPAMIAMAMATLDEIAEGRMQIGLGLGISGLSEMGIKQERPVRALREAIEMIRLLISGDRVEYHGQIYELTGARLGFAPVRKAIPIFVATHGRTVLKLCGEIADGVLLANMGRREAIEEAIALIRAGEAASGRPSGTVAIHLRMETCITDDDDEALPVARRRLAVRLIRTYPHWEYLGRLGIFPTDTMAKAAARADASGVERELSDSDVRATALAGSVGRIVAQLRGLITPDIRTVTIRPMGSDKDDVARIMLRFRNEVWPHVYATAARLE